MTSALISAKLLDRDDSEIKLVPGAQREVWEPGRRANPARYDPAAACWHHGKCVRRHRSKRTAEECRRG